MPHPHDRKDQTRQIILESGAQLFCAKGFDATSIEDVMLACGLTRGGFYAHFRSKADLYEEALADLSLPAEWPSTLFDACRQFPRASAWPFLAIDAASTQPAVRRHYARAVGLACDRMRTHFDPTAAGDDAALAVTAMAVGALAIALSVDDPHLRSRVASACETAIQCLRGDCTPTTDVSAFMGASAASLPAVGDARGEDTVVVDQPILFWALDSDNVSRPRASHSMQ